MPQNGNTIDATDFTLEVTIDTILVQDAMQSMNGGLDAEPDPQAAFNLTLCTFALGDKEMMKQAFSRLVEVNAMCPTGF